ncbi:MAG: hypothetical protein QM535_20220 [Limnohabitans sp.]|nr:hypothetical protein [Limnohabitans sp.]
MKTCFLFSFTKELTGKNSGVCRRNVLVIFFPYLNIGANKDDIQLQLREYFFRHTLPDKLIVICFDFNKDEVKELFINDSQIYDYIPKFNPDENNIHVLSINGKGDCEAVIGEEISSDFLQEVYRRGMTNIFNANGGQIIAQSAHHFVFPSGKHCDRFLRTGNVLLHGSDILFIASAIVLYFKSKIIENIYCDTSSINSLAYAYINLLRDLKVLSNIVHVESFGSYELFEKSTFKAKIGSLFLISSSTSGSILKRMSTEGKSKIALENICVVYGLNVEQEYNKRILCDLTFDSNKNPKGLIPFTSYNVKKGKPCVLCENGSWPVKVEGDVFLLEKPSVIGHRITINDAPLFLKNFSSYYKPNKDEDAIIRCFYKEASTGKKYDHYINVDRLFDLWNTRGNDSCLYKEVYQRLEKFISQNIPATLRYMVVLPDAASLKLARIIKDILNINGIVFKEENILQIKDIGSIDKSQKGVISIVSSSIVSGSNLLFLSRALRDLEKSYQKMYFTFLSRPDSRDHYEFLESNLGMGEFGKGSNRIINVESIFCSQESRNTPWHIELDFLKKLQEFCDEKDDFIETASYCKKRLEELNNSGENVGLDNNLFFPSFLNAELKINNGFAFAPPKKDFIENATQSEIYFIISCVLNEMRSKGKFNQSEYVRNLIEPGNFVRYNDGIIQACILRAAKKDELKFDISEEMSRQMKAILGDMIVHISDNHSEAIIEFFYAIALKKLKLKDESLQDCILLLENQKVYNENDSILRGIVEYIKDMILPKQEIESNFKDTSEQIQQMMTK